MKRRSVRWSEEALKNLRDIILYIRRDSVQRAEEFGRKIIKRVEKLGSFPESGRIVPELQDQNPAPREILIGDYRIIYRIFPRKAEIVTVLHGKRLLSSALETIL